MSVATRKPIRAVAYRLIDQVHARRSAAAGIDARGAEELVPQLLHAGSYCSQRQRGQKDSDADYKSHRRRTTTQHPREYPIELDTRT